MNWFKAGCHRISHSFRVNWPLWGAMAVTAGFAVWVYMLANEVTVQDPYRATRWEHFLHGRPNELGDTLAGFVGSLTLIWVIASVIQQSKELKAQREEFEIMAAAMSKQASVVDEQIKSLKYENQKREKEKIDNRLEVFSKELSALIGLLTTDKSARQSQAIWIVSPGEVFDGQAPRLGRDRSQRLFSQIDQSSKSDKSILNAAMMIVRRAATLKHMKQQGKIKEGPSTKEQLVNVKVVLEKIHDLTKEETQESLGHLSFPVQDAIEALNDIINDPSYLVAAAP